MLRRSLLTAQVHADAFGLDPAGYLQAVLWRLRGLKLRARNRFAALTGQSPHAYTLWVEREEPRIRAAALASLQGDGPAVLPVVDCRSSSKGLEVTLESLSAAGGVILGGPVREGFASVRHPRDLGSMVGSADVWLCAIQPGDLLAPNALRIYSAAAAASRSSLIYADDDLLVNRGERISPCFKPQWNPDLFQHHDFVSGAAIVRASAESFGCLPDEGWFEALIAARLSVGERPDHLPLVLHHRRQRPAPKAPPKLRDFVLQPAPLVSVIVPTRNKLELLRVCIDGLKRTTYPSAEVILIDNGSDEPDALSYLGELEAAGTKVLRLPGPFNFSALNNEAAKVASGDLLCFLNNDIEVIHGDWLALLVRQAVRPELGAVGAKLLYPDGTIQHAGVYLGIGGGAGHGHRFQRSEDSGYFDRARLPQLVSAVTAACLVVARDKFLAVGGFDEANFPVAFNDVDLCLKLNARGWQSFYEPRAVLIHHESKSRGSDSDPANRCRFASELAALKRKWRTDTEQDPFHHPHLSRFCEQFFVAV